MTTACQEDGGLQRRLFELRLAGALVATLPSTGRRMTDFRLALAGRRPEGDPVDAVEAFEAMVTLMHARGLSAADMAPVVSRVRLGQSRLAGTTPPEELVARWLLDEALRGTVR